MDGREDVRGEEGSLARGGGGGGGVGVLVENEAMWGVGESFELGEGEQSSFCKDTIVCQFTNMGRHAALTHPT